MADTDPTSLVRALPSGVYTLGPSVWVLITDTNPDIHNKLVPQLSATLDKVKEPSALLIECGHALQTLPVTAAPAWLSLLKEKRARVTKVAVVSRNVAISSAWTSALLADRGAQVLKLQVFDKADEARAWLAKREAT